MQPHLPPPGGPPTVYVQTTTKTSTYQDYEGKKALIFGIIQVVCGILAFVVNIVLLSIASAGGYSGAGIWGGIMFIIAGAFGIAAGKYKTKCLVITYMVLAIIFCFLGCCGLLGSIMPGFLVDPYQFENLYGEYMPRFYYDHSPYIHGHEYNSKLAVSQGMNSIMALILILEMITLIWGAVLGCKACCCGRPTNQAQNQFAAMPIQYINGQPVVFTGATNVVNANAVYPQTGMAYPPVHTSYAYQPPQGNMPPGQQQAPPIEQKQPPQSDAPPQTPPPSYE